MSASFASWGGGDGGAFHYGYHDGPGVTHLASLERMNEVLAELARVRAGERVLDAGCGVGHSSFHLARARRAAVLGISLSPLQIAEARQVARKLDLEDQVEFLE